MGRNVGNATDWFVELGYIWVLQEKKVVLYPSNFSCIIFEKVKV